MNFTDNPFERMMKQKPRPCRGFARKPPPGSPCRDCSFWQGMACVGTCYKELMVKEERATSGQLGPKSHGG